MNLVFDYSDCNRSLKIPKRFKKIVKEIEIIEEKKLGEICFIFVSQDRILRINWDFLKHDYITDVITFSNTVKHVIAGDIYICADMVYVNASELKIPFIHELRRVMIHGILHLLDYCDDTKEEKELMRKKEDFYLEIVEKKEYW